MVYALGGRGRTKNSFLYIYFSLFLVDVYLRFYFVSFAVISITVLMCCGRKPKVSCDVCEVNDNSNIEQDKWSERERERERLEIKKKESRIRKPLFFPLLKRRLINMYRGFTRA